MFRDLIEKVVISTQPLLDVLKIPDIAEAISGRRMGISASCFRDDGWGYPTTMLRRPPNRHPGLAPGPRLVPGPIQKGRDIKTIPAGCFKDPGYRWGRFRDDGCVLLIPDKRCVIPGRRMGVSHRDGETTHSPSSRACSGTYSKRP